MGRFYSTNIPDRINYAYKAPIDLISKVLNNADTQTDAQLDQLNVIGDELLKVNALDEQKPRAQEILNGYRKNIDDLTTQINTNGFQKTAPALRDLSRRIKNDLFTGELNNIQTNYSEFNKTRARLDTQLARGEITPDQAKASLLYHRSNFAKQLANSPMQFDPVTKTGVQFKADDVYKHYDVNDAVQKALEKVHADLINSQGYKYSDGKYIRGTTKGVEELSPGRIKEAAQRYLLADRQLAGYAKQGAEMGYLPKSVVDSDGNLATAFGYKPAAVDKNGKMIPAGETVNPSSLMYNAINSAVASRSYLNKSSQQTMDENGFAMAELHRKWALEDYDRDHPKTSVEPYDIFTETKDKIEKYTSDSFRNFNTDATMYPTGKEGLKLSKLDNDVATIIIDRIREREQLERDPNNPKKSVTTTKGFADYHMIVDPQNSNNFIVKDKDDKDVTHFSKEDLNTVYSTTFGNNTAKNQLMLKARAGNQNSVIKPEAEKYDVDLTKKAKVVFSDLQDNKTYNTAAGVFTGKEIKEMYRQRK